MKIVLAKNIGFCFGVKNAILAATNAARDTKGIYSLGELIHNKKVLENFEKMGIRTIYDMNEIEQGTVIIRSHGVGDNIYKKLEEKKLKVIDATCPFVRAIHEIVKSHYLDGYKIVIIGKKEHPEVVGINGWCNNEAEIVNENYDISALENYDKLCVVVQTTHSEHNFVEITKKITNLRLKTVEIFDTICYTTKERQAEVTKIASTCDAVLVVGDKKSSNTTKLSQIAGQICPNVHLIEDVGSLKNIKLTPVMTVGILAGASTPKELVMEVYSYMSQNFEEVQNQEFISGIEESLISYKEGKRVKGTIIRADEKGISVNIGGKKDGLIVCEEVSLDGNYDPDDYKPGMEVDAIIINKNDAESGCVLLSKKRVDLIKEGDKVVETIRAGEVFELKVEKEIKGGLLSKLGTYSVFIPASQVKERFVKDLKPFVGKTLRLTALEIDDNKHKIVASQRKVLEAERIEKEELFWTHVQPNVVVSGVVKRITSFGAFVAVAGFDCLCHIVDISWSHIDSIEEVLTIGKSYDFLVLKADREKNRVSLGFKQLQQHPFVIATEKYPVDSIVRGKVVNIMPYGAFVEIEKGVEGLVHVSETARSYIKDINEVLKVGDEVDVKVLGIDEDARKITLSIKACLPEEEIVANDSSEQDGTESQQSNEKQAKGKNNKKFDRKPKMSSDEQKEWSEEIANNPFAHLLKDLDITSKD